MARHLSKIGWGVPVVAVALYPLFSPQYLVHLGVMVGIFGLLAISLNVVSGLTGPLSLGHGAFFAIGSYAVAILTTRAHLSFWAAMLLAGLICAAAGILLGLPSLRVRDTYFTVITLSFHFVVLLLCINLKDLTGGTHGISGIPRPSIAGLSVTGTTPYYYLVLIILAAALLFTWALVNSRFGRAFIALRENEEGATASGVNPVYYKLLAFSISAFIGGISGALYAPYMRFINPDAFAFGISINALVMVVLGGMGSIAGPVLGTAVVVLLPEVLRFARQYYFAVYGLLVMVVVLFLPEGLISIGTGLRRMPTRRRTT